MKRHIKILGWFGIVILFSGMAVSAYAQNAKVQKRRALAQNALGLKGAFAGLNLTPEQKEQIRSILAGHKAEITAVAKENAAARRELAAAMAEGPSSAALKTAYDKVSAAGWDRLQLRLKIMAEMKGVLTPEQLQKMENRKQLRKNFAKKMIKKQL